MSGGVDPNEAWEAAVWAVETALGGAVPQTRGVRAGGVRQPLDAAWRRKVAIYTAVTGLGASMLGICRVTGTSQAWASELLGKVEDARDDGPTDQLLEQLRAMASVRLYGRAEAA